MGKIVVLGGDGIVGSVAARDLAETYRGEILVASNEAERVKKFVRSLGKKNVRSAYIEAKNHGKLVKLLKGSDVVLNAVQYYFNLDIMRAALAAGANYLDLGGLFHTTKKQLKLHSSFKRRGLVAILGCGSTPGITNMLAKFGSALFDRIDSVHVQFADRDYTKYKIPFVIPYSSDTLFDEFSMKPAVFENGKLIFVPPVSGHIEVRFPSPVNEAQCFYTLHSEVATFPSSFRGKGIKNVSFRGGFDPWLVEKIKFLMDAGFASEKMRIGGEVINQRRHTTRILNRFIPSKDTKVKDVEFLRVEISGRSKGKQKKIAVYCMAKTEKRWNIPAGTWDTGVPASVIAQMIADGRVARKGVMPPELCLDAKKFFSELGKRGMRIFVRRA